VDEGQLYAQGWRYEDLVAAADAVVTKPGYGIISECIANKTAMLYTSRGHFIEYDVLVRDMPRYLNCEFISQEDLHAGRWAQPLRALLERTDLPRERLDIDGASVVAKRILEYVSRD
jgi:L-arabinokinase